MKGAAQHSIKAWWFQSMLLERYRYAPGAAEEVPKHSHDEYQFCLSSDFPGEYYYRGAAHPVPSGSVSVIHPGEIHSARDPADRHRFTTFRMMFASPDLLQSIATQLAGRDVGLPFFTQPIVVDQSLATIALRFHIATEGSASRLEQESLLLQLLSEWILRHAEQRSKASAVAPEREAVRQVREYLQDRFHENVTLDRLSQITNLSPYHLSRVFANEVGIPPHQYQAQVRIARAKLMLMKGMPIGQVAIDTGFADQSHFGRYFKRYMQVSPRRYQRQDNSARSF